MDTEFKNFFANILDLMDLENSDNKKQIIECLHDFKKDIDIKLNRAYDVGLLDGGYAMDKIKNEYVILDEKFDDEDPIFQLDVDVPILKKQQIETIKSTVKPSATIIASSIVSYGFSKSKKTTKYFKQ